MGPGRACQVVRASKEVCPVLYCHGTDWALIRVRRLEFNSDFVEEGEVMKCCFHCFPLDSIEEIP
eukprot:6550874-Ditylum_brightwellii.AAC.1